MKIPEAIKIGGITYKIVIVDNLDDCCGEIDREHSIIKLAKENNDDFQFLTLLHEIFHAINWEFSEVTIEFLAHTMFQVLKDNDFLREDK